MEMLKKLVVEEEGQGMTEYGLVLGVIAIAVIAILGTLRDEITTMFEDVVGKIQNRETGGTS